MLQGHCGESRNTLHLTFTEEAGKRKITPELQSPPDFEEVIERGIPVVAQGIFIFQILKQEEMMEHEKCIARREEAKVILLL